MTVNPPAKEYRVTVPISLNAFIDDDAKGRRGVLFLWYNRVTTDTVEGLSPNVRRKLDKDDLRVVLFLCYGGVTYFPHFP